MQFTKTIVSRLSILVIGLALFGLGCHFLKVANDDDTADREWSYDGDTGPEHWGELSLAYVECSDGQEQSPVDIVTANVTTSDLPDIQFHYEPAVLNVLNNGHTVEAEYEEMDNFIEVNGTRFDLLQFHFHTPSEHTANGSLSKLEMHLVHKAVDGTLAVIGVFINEGSENQAFNPIWDHLPAMKGDHVDLENPLDVSDLLPTDRRTYRYSGSLTTPPCSEIVSWFMIAAAIEMSPAQTAAFGEIFHANARPVQALHGRTISLDSSTN